MQASDPPHSRAGQAVPAPGEAAATIDADSSRNRDWAALYRCALATWIAPEIIRRLARGRWRLTLSASLGRAGGPEPDAGKRDRRRARRWLAEAEALLSGLVVALAESLADALAAKGAPAPGRKPVGGLAGGALGSSARAAAAAAAPAARPGARRVGLRLLSGSPAPPSRVADGSLSPQPQAPAAPGTSAAVLQARLDARLERLASAFAAPEPLARKLALRLLRQRQCSDAEAGANARLRARPLPRALRHSLPAPARVAAETLAGPPPEPLPQPEPPGADGHAFQPGWSSGNAGPDLGRASSPNRDPPPVRRRCRPAIRFP